MICTICFAKPPETEGVLRLKIAVEVGGFTQLAETAADEIEVSCEPGQRINVKAKAVNRQGESEWGHVFSRQAPSEPDAIRTDVPSPPKVLEMTFS